jgi:hypothetical protein
VNKKEEDFLVEVNEKCGYCHRCDLIHYKDDLNEIGEYDGVTRYLCEGCWYGF